MVINISVQYNGGFLPDIILLTQGYLHRDIRLNTMKKFLMPGRSRCVLICTTYGIILLFLWYCTALCDILLKY